MKVGRPELNYEPKKIQKWVPLEIYDYCLSLIDAEVQKYKLKNKNHESNNRNIRKIL